MARPLRDELFLRLPLVRIFKIFYLFPLPNRELAIVEIREKFREPTGNKTFSLYMYVYIKTNRKIPFLFVTMCGSGH